jgi:DNA-binding SARP family transcriptional activator
VDAARPQPARDTGFAASRSSAAPAATAAPLRLALFGELRVEVRGHDVTGRLPGRQGRVLLAYLVLNGSRPVSRDELLDVLWPSRPPAAPDSALGSVLAKVRRVLGPDTIAGRQALALRLPAGAQVDVRDVDERIERAEHALAEDDPATALEAAQTVLDILDRPLLANLDGDWIAPWRRRFDELAPRALEIAARAGLALGAGRLPAAERAAAALVAREPFREGGHALLIRAQARQGNVAEALLSFDRLRVRLRDELGTSPSPSLVALHEDLLRAGPPAAASAPDEPPARTVSAVTSTMIEGAFCGRGEPTLRLRSCWEQCVAGQIRLALIVGDPGAGKTRLAAQFAEEVHAGGGTVLYGRADEDALLPHQAFVEAVRQLIAQGDAELAAAAEQDREILLRLLPDLAAPGATRAGQADDADHTLRYRLFEAVAGLLRAALRRSPVLLVLDDLHWADKPTLLLMRHLLRHPQLRGLLVVGAFRDAEVDRGHPLTDLLGDLRRELRYDRLTLGGLDLDATRALVADRLARDVTPAFVRRLHAQTEGNPFFVEETIRALVDAGVPGGEPLSEDALERLDVPDGVAEIVARRVGNLSAAAAEALTAASVAGRGFRLEVVAQIVGASPEQVMGALEECMAAGLACEEPDRVDAFAFSHGLVREVLYRGLSVSRRTRLHHAVAQALEALARTESVNPAALAQHFAQARHFTGPGPARRYAIEAARRATELLAYEEAAGHYELAATLFEDDDDEERCEVLLALGRAQWRAGSDGARQTFRSAATCAARRGDAEQLARAALGHGARYHEAGYAGAHDRELLERSLAALHAGDGVHRALLLGRLAGNLAFAGEQHQRASALALEALAVARRLGDANVLVAALIARHATLLHVDDIDARLAVGEELMALEPASSELLAERCHWRLYDLLESGDATASRAEQAGFEALAERMHQPQWHSIAIGWRGLWAELDGDVAEAERCSIECLREGQRADLRDALSTSVAKLLMLRRRAGRLDELAPVVEQLVRGADVRNNGFRSAHGLILAETGHEVAARAIYRDELATYRDALPQFWLTSAAMLAELCVRLGDAEGARALYASLAPSSGRNVVVSYASCWGPVDRYLALLAGTFGDESLRERHARAALARTREMGAPLLTMQLEREHGGALAA